MLESCKLLLFDDLDSLFLSILSFRRLLNEVYIDFQTFSLGETKSPTLTREPGALTTLPLILKDPWRISCRALKIVLAKPNLRTKASKRLSSKPVKLIWFLEWPNSDLLNNLFQGAVIRNYHHLKILLPLCPQQPHLW